MADPGLWALMQRIETCRYNAERVERAGALWPTPLRELAFDIARQWRQIADQAYALHAGREIEAVSPLRPIAEPAAPAPEGAKAAEAPEPDRKAA